MLPDVVPIAGTAIDWMKFVSTINDILGRSPTRELDNCGLPVGTPPTYISALAEFNRQGSNPIMAVQNADRLLEHLSFSFLVSCDRDMMMIVLKQTVGLNILSAEPSRGRENFIITGTLRNWKTVIVEGSGPDSCVEARQFFNEVWKCLDKLGLRDLFANLHRRELRDRTFALEHKRK